MQPLLQSLDLSNNINRDPHGFGLSQATFINDQASDVQKIYEDLYSKVKNGDQKGVRYLLGINDNDSFCQMQPINIQKIMDEKKNTLLMHAVWKDHTNLFTDLIKYSLKLFGETDTQQWVTQQNDSGNQCMHLATQKGNIAILDSILKLGIKLDKKTRLGQTTLHIASQSDQPIMLYYLVKIAKVNIDTIVYIFQLIKFKTNFFQLIFIFKYEIIIFSILKLIVLQIMIIALPYIQLVTQVVNNVLLYYQHGVVKLTLKIFMVALLYMYQLQVENIKSLENYCFIKPK